MCTKESTKDWKVWKAWSICLSKLKLFLYLDDLMYKTVFDSHNMHVVLFVSHHSLLKTAVSEPMVMTVLFVATLAMSSKKEEADNV